MAGVQQEIRLQDLAIATATLEQLARIDRRHLLENVTAIVESQTRRRIEEDKAAPDGTPWPEWSEGYAATRHAGHSLLENEGDLLDSIAGYVDGETGAIGSNLIYAAIQHHGGGEVGINIPAREFLGLSSEDAVEIMEEVTRFIGEVLQ